MVMKPVPLLVANLPEHQQLKQMILNGLQGAAHEAVSVTNWHLPGNHCLDMLITPLQNVADKMFAPSGHGVTIANTWFQQYHTGSHHGWHTHRNAHFSCIYYLELPAGTPATEFKDMHGNIFTVPVTEGQVLAAPAFFIHQSPPNASELRKTVVAFNVNLHEKTTFTQVLQHKS
jgi:hypothetical protein